MSLIPIHMRHIQSIYAGMIILATGVFLLSGCSQERSGTEKTVVAEIGDRQITEDEFLRSYAFAPASLTNGSPADAKQRLLKGLIEEKLLARAAERDGLGKDPWVQRKLRYQEGRAVIRELYRRRVQQKVIVSQAEIDSVFDLKSYELRVRHLFTEDKTAADRLYARLQQGASFRELAREVFDDPQLAENGGYLGVVSWGELDQSLEAVLFELPVGEISKPVKSGYGYHILRVDERVKNVFQTVSSFTNESQTIETVLRRRKARTRAHRFIQTTMEPLNVTMKAAPFWQLVDKIWAEFRPQPDTLKTYLQNPEVDFLRTALSAYMNAPLVSSSVRNWTLAEVLELYRLHPMDFSLRSHAHLAASLKNIIGILTRDDYLAQLGREMGLAGSPRVQRSVTQWRDRLLTDRLKKVMCDSLTATNDYKNIADDTGDPSISMADNSAGNQSTIGITSVEQRQEQLRTLLKVKLEETRRSVSVKIHHDVLARITLPDAGDSRKIDLIGVWQQ